MTLFPYLSRKNKLILRESCLVGPLSVVFDGTTRLGEAMAVVVRYIDTSFSGEVEEAGSFREVASVSLVAAGGRRVSARDTCSIDS